MFCGDALSVPLCVCLYVFAQNTGNSVPQTSPKVFSYLKLRHKFIAFLISPYILPASLHGRYLTPAMFDKFYSSVTSLSG